MSVEETWQENKSFILALAGGALVFFIAWLLITSSFEEDIERDLATARRARSQESRQRLPSGAKAEAEDALRALKASLQNLERELAYQPRAGFSPESATKAADIHFNEIVQKLLVEVVEPAASLDIRIARDLGLGGVTPRSNADRAWYLAGLDVVHRIALVGVASGVRSIDPIAISAPPKATRSRPTTPYLREITVTFTAHGRPEAIDALLRGLVRPGERLALERATITSMEAAKNAARFDGEDIVRLEAQIKALLLDPQGDPATSTGSKRS